MFKKFVLIALVTAHASYSSNYQLQISDLFQSCDYIHEDAYSLDSIADTIRDQLDTKLEADRECNATFNEMNTSFENISTLIDKTVDPALAESVYNETYTSYLVNLTQEASILDQSDPEQKYRYDFLLSQIDSLKSQLYNNQYQLELNKEVYSSDVSVQFKKDIFNYSKSLFTALNNAPKQCIDRLGGWGQIVPAILKISSMIGSTLGPTGMVVGAGLSAASELTVLLQNARVKKAIADINRRKNEQIIACTYLSLQNTACDLKRAKDFVDNKEKIKAIIFRDLDNSKYKEYEEFYTALNSLPKVQEILNSIGSMGSAVTLDVDLISRYFRAIRIRPDEVNFPSTTATDEEKRKFTLEMKNRGVTVEDFNYQTQQPIPIDVQINNIKVQVDLAKSTISAVVSILQEKRSFLDLQSELTIKSVNIKNEMDFIKKFLEKQKLKENFPNQYLGLFRASTNMLEKLIAFLGVSLEGREYDDFAKEVNEKGTDLFTTMSYGSVAQITTQTALMIPSIAYERFNRPFKALENFYLNNDIIKKDDPSHIPFSDYMVNESLQMKVLNDYKHLTGSRMAFRLESYESIKKSFEKGFKREIKRMVKNSLSSSSNVLSSFNGKTAAHMCSLFSPFLKEYSSKLLKECQERHKTLDLLSVLDDFKKKTEMEIDYNNSCFYSNYKREELGQRILFDRLLDYGFSKL